MTTASWENQLLTWAYESLEEPPAQPIPSTTRAHLADAYGLCEAVTASHSRTFHLASALLPQPKREAVRALYAFCRTTDDIVDRCCVDGGASPLDDLTAWRQHTLCGPPAPDDHLALAWKDVQASYGIPAGYAEQLIDGVARDLTQTRYATFDELATYCYSVASTVGLMAMHIIGFSGPDAVPYAVKLGVALQLTNILRDVAEDWRAGRLYLPLDELADFRLVPEDVGRGIATGEWRRFMTFQIDRVRALYAEALPGIRHLHRDGRFAIGAAAELYAGILDDIESHRMDVFSRRAHTTRLGKMRRLPAIWWRSSVVGYHSPRSDRATRSTGR